MNFESPDVEREFPGLYGSHAEVEDEFAEEDERGLGRKKDSGKKKESKKERKDKGYTMFEEEDSEEELMVGDDTRSPSKMKKHGKHSFKFAKKEKFYKPKEKDPPKEKDERKDKLKLKKKKFGSSNKDISAGGDYKPIFGVPVAVAVERSKCHDGIQLPAIFRECVDYIEEYGLSCEGIYRISGVKSKVQALKECYNKGEPAALQDHEPNIVASLLKQYLRDLPEPVLTQELMPKFEQASTIKNVKQKVESFQQLIEELPVPNRHLLSWTIVHMTHIIARESQNKMSLQNVSIVLSPSMQISHRVLNVFFTYSKILFRDTVLKRYVPPLRPCTSRWSLELPESPTALEEELRKQESLLNQLHEDLMKENDPEKEEQLWEVQRVVTGLKRKVRNSMISADTVSTSSTTAANTITPTATSPTVALSPLEEELQRQESILARLHADLMIEADPHKEEQVWEVQRQVTALKRKLKAVKKSQEVTKPGEKGGQTRPETNKKPPHDRGDEGINFTLQKPDPEKIRQQQQQQQAAAEAGDDNVKAEKDDVATDDDGDKTETEEEPVTPGEVVKGGEKAEKATDRSDAETPDETNEEKKDVSKEEEKPEEEPVPKLTLAETESAEKILEDFKQMEIVKEIEDEELEQLIIEHTTLMLEEEELIAIGDELHAKIETEQGEIERLHQEIAELQAIRDEMSSDEMSSSSSDSSDDEDEEELLDIIERIAGENKALELQNADFCEKIHQERQICLQVKVEIRMIQQRQSEAIDAQLAAERETLMQF